MKMKNKHLVALLTNNDDDIYCFRKELIEEIINSGYEMLISCPDGEKFELIEYRRWNNHGALPMRIWFRQGAQAGAAA